MNHINYRKYSLIAISLISLCLFSACDEDEYEEKIVGDDTTQKVYLSNGMTPMDFMDLTVQFNPAALPEKVEYKVPIRTLLSNSFCNNNATYMTQKHKGISGI